MGSSSLSLLVLEMLCAELLLGGKLIAARKIGMEFKVRSEQFPIARLPNDDMIAVFGRFPSVLPFCEKNYDYTVPEKRIKGCQTLFFVQTSLIFLPCFRVLSSHDGCFESACSFVRLSVGFVGSV